ncbi:MAG: transcriptional repressor [Bacteroidales bacterium]|nr:transcriptional repressor [Bacteroidales bacterium]MBR0291646.1 transcriptional repressor [Bacteroidales bacterium]
MTRSTKRKAADEEAFRKRLKAHGLKVTGQRLAVHGAMMSLVHASAEQVRERIGSSCRISLASVYNILSELADNNIYSRRLSANNKMYFDVFPERHVHLYDTRNNEYLDIEGQDLLDTIEAGLKRHRFRGYKIDGFDIQILCHPTRKKLL